MGKRSRKPQEADDASEPVLEAEVEAWASEERKRRQAWLEGPTEEEKQAWAEREKRRRRRGIDHEHEPMDVEELIAEGRRLSDKFQNNLSLILAGAASQLVNSPYRVLGSLLRTGRDLEDDYHTPRRRHRRVPLDLED